MHHVSIIDSSVSHVFDDFSGECAQRQHVHLQHVSKFLGWSTFCFATIQTKLAFFY
jgi:hypothetical protein